MMADEGGLKAKLFDLGRSRSAARSARLREQGKNPSRAARR